jgi:hypothetical protein
MSALVQTSIVVLIVLIAAAYVGRKIWLALRPKAVAGCDSGCGCAAADTSEKDWAKT